MVIVDENMTPVFLDNIEIPMLIDYFWVLDLEQKDFMLTELYMSEEIITPSLTLNILGAKVKIPTSWNILVASDDTYQLDIVSATDLTKANFSAAIYDHEKHRIRIAPIQVKAYTPIDRICAPTLHKTQMLCVGVAPQFSIALTPTDNFSKYLKGASVSDLLY